MADMTSKTGQAVQDIVITRDFDAPRERVWRAWTDPEQIRRWWGPEPFTAPTVRLDLRVGGKYVWSMRGPAGTQWDREMFNAGVFEEIVVHEKLVLTQYMSDGDGNKIDVTQYGQQADFPDEFTITVLFEDVGKGRTRLSIVYPKPESEAQFQAMLKSGMKEGWESSMNKLAQALR
jgi:uncharacterized protein YndB with AHSA1/START domain